MFIFMVDQLNGQIQSSVCDGQVVDERRRAARRRGHTQTRSGVLLESSQVRTRIRRRLVVFEMRRGERPSARSSGARRQRVQELQDELFHDSRRQLAEAKQRQAWSRRNRLASKSNHQLQAFVQQRTLSSIHVSLRRKGL